MDWSTVAITVVGAIVGVGATLIGERFRWSREQERERQSVLRAAYSRYLAALVAAAELMRSINRTHFDGPQERDQLIRDAFHDSRLYEYRFELEVVAPPKIVAVAVDAFRRIRDLRDQLLVADVDDPATAQALTEFSHSIRAAVKEMRADIGSF